MHTYFVLWEMAGEQEKRKAENVTVPHIINDMDNQIVQQGFVQQGL